MAAPGRKTPGAPQETRAAHAANRINQLHASGYSDAQVYNPTETSVRGLHAFFLLLGEPEAYGLPPKPEVPTIYLRSAWMAAFGTALGALILVFVAFLFG